MKLKATKFIVLVIGLAAFFTAFAAHADVTFQPWSMTSPNVLMTNTGNGLANADIHVAHCYIGTGTGTLCGGGSGGSPASPNDGIQYNNNGDFGADSSHIIDPTTGYTNLVSDDFVVANPVTFTGSGENDLQVSTETFTGDRFVTYTITIDSVGSPDTFSWTSSTGGSGSMVPINGGNQQTLDNGFMIQFDSSTGHTIGNSWNVTFSPAAGTVFIDNNTANEFGIGSGGNFFNTSNQILSAYGSGISSGSDDLSSSYLVSGNFSLGNFSEIKTYVNASGNAYFGFTSINGSDTGEILDNGQQTSILRHSGGVTSVLDTTLGESALSYQYDGTDQYQSGIRATRTGMTNNTELDLESNGFITEWPITQGSTGDIPQLSSSGTLAWTPTSSIVPTLAQNEIGFGDSSNLLSGSGDLTWDGTTFLAGNAGNEVINGNAVTDDAGIGDLNGNTSTDTSLQVFNSVGSGFIQAQVANSFIVQNLSGQEVIYGGGANHQFLGGDVDDGQNGTFEAIDDGLQQFYIANTTVAGGPGTPGLMVDFANGMYTLGAKGFGNNTYFQIDDGNKESIFSERHFVIGGIDLVFPAAQGAGVLTDSGSGVTSWAPVSFSSLSSKPTTLSGYGITDAYPLTGNPSGFLTSSSTVPWSQVTSAPTTLAGYGITNAPTIAGTGDVTAQTTANSSIAAFTTGGATSTYRIGGYLNITALSLDVIQLQCTYTDENSNIQTVILATGSTVVDVNVQDQQIRAKNGTVITIKTVLTTGTGSITYDAGGTIEKVR